MENQNSQDELHYMLGIVDTNIKKIKKYSNTVQIEDLSPRSHQDMWESNNMRLEAQEELSEPHRSSMNIA